MNHIILYFFGLPTREYLMPLTTTRFRVTIYTITMQSPTITALTFKQLVAQYKYYLTSLFILVAGVTGLSLAIPNITGELIKSLEIGRPDWGWIWTLGGVVVALLIIEFLQVTIGAVFREKVGFDLRGKLMDKLTTQNYTNVNNIGIGQIITLFGSDIDNVKNIMAGELVLSVKAMLLFVGALVLIFATNWKLGLIAFISLPVIVAAFALIFKSVTKYFKLSQENQTDLNNAISQNIYGSNLVRVQNSQEWETDKFNLLTNESKNISFKIIEAFSSLIPIINTISNWTTFGILYFGALTYIAGQIKLGDINAYISYYALLTAPIFIIGFNSQGIARLGVSLKRINELLSNPEESPSGTLKKPIKKGLKVKNVNLEYGGKQVLKNINFMIPVGKKTAILGPTGAGKSLLINLLTGMIHPTSGEITIDDKLLKEWNEDFIKDRITTVYQESLIFSGNLKQNVVLNREWNQDKYTKAMSTATLEKLDKDKGGVSELGANLSGGQKQRLTLARALYNNPQFLLLDDFTARVDDNTENTIQSRLASNYPNTTIVSISQNISSIKNYDQIILIMEGEILMIGTHEELLKSSPEYRQILASQQTI
jgi:ATP-binding cassette, subfamily B, bacterial